MYKLVVVDDEFWIRQRISREVEWKQLQVQVVGEAEDGEEALGLIESLEPDIVITDIRMPVLDGLELMRCLEKLEKIPKLIILSGYDDFAYAKEALQYGAFDYILKPVTDEMLLEVVERCIRSLRAEHEKKQEIKALRRAANEGYQAVKEKLLRDIVEGDYYEGIVVKKEERLYSAESIFEEAIKQKFHVCICMCISCRTNDVAEKQLDSYILVNMLEELLEKYGICSRTPLQNSREWMFVLSIINDEDVLLIEKIQKDLEVARELAEEKLNVNLWIGIGEKCDDFWNLSYSWNTVSSLLKYCRRMGVKIGIFNTNSFSVEIRAQDKYSVEQLKELLLQKKISAAKLEVANIYQEIQRKCMLNQDKVVWRMALIDIEKEFYQYFFINFGENCANYFRLEFWCTLDEMELPEDILGLIGKFADDHKRAEHRGKRVAQKICDYVLENYNRPISLNDVSEFLQMNPSYLCRVFKEEMKISFVSFVQKCRIDKAVELLKNSNYKVYEIGEMVGYDNQQYFNKVFKNVKGISPAIYRENMRA